MIESKTQQFDEACRGHDANILHFLTSFATDKKITKRIGTVHEKNRCHEGLILALQQVVVVGFILLMVIA